MNPESIDRIEHSTYTPLEKKYLKVQFVKVALVYSQPYGCFAFFFVQRGLLTGMPLLSLLNAVCL
ncbi:MAG: hypothetical protein ACLUHA_02045 [Bacteroides stercoris]